MGTAQKNPKKKSTKKKAIPKKKQYGRTFSVYTKGDEDPLYEQVDQLQEWMGLRSRSDVVRAAIGYFYNSVKEERRRMREENRKKKAASKKKGSGK